MSDQDKSNVRSLDWYRRNGTKPIVEELPHEDFDFTADLEKKAMAVKKEEKRRLEANKKIIRELKLEKPKQK